ncbi:hypothetical protein K470DRAFT_209856 [Piedraia hortae CBS 480.64]|uniref:GPN-loop GTPase 2 n=1 Tax=Piedraia hortae CBS 480.64 TaxID=1314780 RepID=A0A6A7C8D9_9PEZI|nr:hypothetical protein K470DRAFT_209856 [Piedraia hortae CBS 480.64]
MRTIILPMGPPGSGKSTLTNGLQQFLTALGRPCDVANLDPANENIQYTCIFDVRDLVSVQEVMEQHGLGPNGGVLWAMDEVEHNLEEWLLPRVENCSETLILDPPGQPELMIHHTALPRILERLEKEGNRIVVVQLIDSVVLTRPSLYLSSLLICVRGMLHLPYPLVNVLTKMDNLKAVGGADLPFNLDFYTEMQDLQLLIPALEAEQADSMVGMGSEKWKGLNEALISLIEDAGLLGFETLAVEDKASMASLVKAIDRASGYALAGARATDEFGRTLQDETSVWAQAMSDHWAGKLDIRDVQERWIDRKEEFDEMERKAWEEEARLAGALDKDGDVPVDEEEDPLIAEQRKWMEQQSQGTKVVRK